MLFRSKFTSFIGTASLQTLRLLRDRAKSLTLAAVVIGSVSVIGASLLVADRGDLEDIARLGAQGVRGPAVAAGAAAVLRRDGLDP